MFQTANEMVAEERKMRSKLEERVNVLEKREKEKEGRLGMLERAVDTISRVRVLLNGTGENGGPEEAELVEGAKKGAADKQSRGPGAREA